MPARVLVYCKRSVGDVTAEMLADETLWQTSKD